MSASGIRGHCEEAAKCPLMTQSRHWGRETWCKTGDVRSGTEIKVKGLFIRAKTLCAERWQSVHKRFPLDRHQTRERLIKPQNKENCSRDG